MLRVLPTLIEPEVWTLAFHRTSKRWWVRWLAVGKYKHVSAFAWVPALNLWVVYDVTVDGTHILMLPDSPTATAWLSDRTADADLMRMPRVSGAGRMPIIAPFYCVPAIRHLICLSNGTLRPTSLYRDCLANGGQPIGRPAENDHRSGDPAHSAGSAG